ncbi:Hsp70 family protein [Haloglomus halophilum]|uniref:Hsp70 family protein n=1 Tax=Haloglomus halophilum TaxID=2962672 RepID=UPI0020C9D8C6|nr:Hsp70 family protein [Haloglomus halophilum]
MRIGIDLGTTNSAMAYLDAEDGGTEMIQNDRGDDTTPSVVLIEEDADEGDQITVGEAALTRRRISPERVLARTKQDIDKEEEVTYEIGGEEYTPVQAASYILGYLKEQAEQSLDEAVEGAVITVPYDFANRGRQRTEKAAEAAGFEVDEIINEPTAACLSYIHQEDVDGTLLVYDLGGGTFDATLVEAGALINVVSTEGDGELGGEDFDDALYEHVSQKIVDEGGPDPADAHEQDQASLQKEVKDAKHDLSDLNNTMFVWENTEVEVTREEFESVIDDKIQQTIEKMDALFEKDAVQDEGIDKGDIDNVLLVGGSTRIPLVSERVEAFFEQEPKYNVDPDTVVARGAALQAAEYREEVPDDMTVDVTIHNVLSHNVGVELDDDTFDEILPEDVNVPTDETRTYTNPRDNISKIRVPVWEKAEDGAPVEKPDDAEELGELMLEGIPERPAGELDIEVTFDAGHDGTLHVEAVELETGTTVETTLEIGIDDPFPPSTGDGDQDDTIPRPGDEFDASRPGAQDEEAADD